MSELQPNYTRYLNNAEASMTRIHLERHKTLRGQGEPNKNVIVKETQTTINELRYAIGEISLEEYEKQAQYLSQKKVENESNEAA